MRFTRFLVLAMSAIGGVLLACGTAAAHDLNAKIEVRADSVRVEAFFDDDTPADIADAIITSADGVEIATGKTDERGVWTFPRPTPGDYVLTVKSIGHIATVQFSVSGEPQDTPAVFTGWRLNKVLGLAIGLAVLLFGSTALRWLLRNRLR